MIGIRADGNNQIGIGHVMRCLTIAEALRDGGAEVIFLVADMSCKEMICGRGFVCRVLETSFSDMETEQEKLYTALEELHIDCLLIDSYYVTKEYLEGVRQHVQTIYLDDVDSFPYPVDLLINYNVFAKAMDYPYGVEYVAGVTANESGKEKFTKVLAGAQYAPVRTEFVTHPMEFRDSVEHVLISSGGSDAHNLSYKIAKKLLFQTKATLHVICGPFNLHKDKLYVLADEEVRVVIHENVKDMWNLMQNCDIAVSAAGSTMCELAVVGVPTVTFSFVDNQRKIAETFGEKKAAICLGHYVPAREKEFLSAMAAEVQKLCDSGELRKALSRCANHLVDGKGAKRIADAILNRKEQ